MSDPMKATCRCGRPHLAWRMSCIVCEIKLAAAMRKAQAESKALLASDVVAVEAQDAA